MNQVSEAAHMATGGNGIITILFWAFVAFVGYLVWSGKWKLIVAATNPTATALSLGKDAISDLVSSIFNRLQAGPDAPPQPEKTTEAKLPVSALPTGDIPAYMERANSILQGVPAEKRWEIAAKGLDDLGLYREANAYLLRKGGESLGQ